MEGIEARTQQLQTSLQNLYTSAGLQDLYGALLGIGSNVLEYYNNISAAFGSGISGAAAAVATFGAQFYNLANVVTNVVKLVKNHYIASQKELTILTQAEEELRQQGKISSETESALKTVRIWKNAYKEITSAAKQEAENASQAEVNAASKAVRRSKIGNLAYGVGTAGSLVGTIIGGQTGNLVSGVSGVAGAIGAFIGHNWLGSVMSLIGAIPSLFSAISGSVESTTEKIERLGSVIEETDRKQAQSKKALKTLADYKKQYDELQKSQYQDEEHRKQWIDLNNQIAASYPELIKGMDAEGNYVVDMTAGYQQLAQAKANAYKTDFFNLVQSELTGLKDLDYVLKTIYEVQPLGSGGLWSSNASIIEEIESPNKLYELYKENLATLTDIFVSPFGRKGVQLGPNVDIEKVLKPYNESWNNSIQAFKEQALSGKSYIDAVTNITEQFGEDVPIIQQDIYNYWINRKAAIQFQENLLNNQIATYADSWLQYLQTLTGITSNDLQLNLMSREIVDEWDNYYELHKNDMKTVDGGKLQSKTYGEIFTDFIQNEYIPDWYYNTEQTTHYLQDKALEELWATRNYYTRDQLAAIDWGEQQEEILSIYDNEFANIFAEYRNKMQYLADITTADDKAWEDGLNSIADLNQEAFAPAYLLSMADNYEKIININKENEDAATRGLLQLDAIYSNIGSINNEDLQRKVMSIVSSGDLFSITGIYEILSQLSTLDWGEDQNIHQLLSENTLPDLIDYLNINVLTNYELFTSSFSSSLKDLSTALSNAEKGMSLEDAIQMANSLDISLDEFSFRQGKYYYDKIDVISQKYMENYETILAKIDEFYDDAINAEDADVEGLERARANAHKGIKQSYDYINKTIFLNAGRIGDFLAGTGITEDALYASLAQGNVPSQLRNYTSELIQWYNSINDEVYKAFIDSLANGEATTITITKENQGLLKRLGIIDGLAEIGQTAVINFSNATVDTIKGLYDVILNDAAISPKEKDSYLKSLDDEIISRNKANVLKEVTNSYASFDRALATRYAEAFGFSIDELDFNETTRTFSVTLAQLQEQLNKVISEGADAETVAELQDAIRSIRKDIGNLIASGLKGTLTNAEKFNLIDLTQSWNIDLTFKETNEGLQLSRDSAIALYIELLKIDSIAANIVFTNLKEQFTEVGEVCENISSTMSSIARLEQEIKSNTNGTNKELENRLDIYKRIAAEQMNDPNSYQFMNRSLPNGMQSPINYWESAYSMRETMVAAAENGNIGVQDFYNIVNEMNYWASLGAENISFMGENLDGSMTSAAALIEKGMRALKVVDGKTVVDFESFGINFANGADEMATGVDSGIKEFANSQIKILDSLINYLETIVAMEQLSETGEINWQAPLFGENGELTDEGIANAQKMHELATIVDESSGELTAASQTFQNTLREYQLWDGMTLWDALGAISVNSAQVGEWSDEQVALIKAAYAEIIAKVYADYNANDFPKLIEMLFGKTSTDGTIPEIPQQQLDLVLNFSGNGTIEDAEKFASMVQQFLEIDGTGNVTIQGESADATFTLDIQNNGAVAKLTWGNEGTSAKYNSASGQPFEIWLMKQAKAYASRQGLTGLGEIKLSTDAVKVTNGQAGSSIDIEINYSDDTKAAGIVTIGEFSQEFGPNSTYRSAAEALSAVAQEYNDAHGGGTLHDINFPVQNIKVTSSNNVAYTFDISSEGTTLGDISDKWDTISSDIETLIAEAEGSNITQFGDVTITKSGNKWTVGLNNISIDGITTVTYTFDLDPQNLSDEDAWITEAENIRQVKETYGSHLSSLAQDLGIKNFSLTKTDVQSGRLGVLMSVDGKSVVNVAYDIEWGNGVTPEQAASKIDEYRARLDALISKEEQFKNDYTQIDDLTENEPIDLFPQAIQYNATKTIQIVQAGYDVYDENGHKLGHYDTDNSYNAVIAAFNSDVDTPPQAANFVRRNKELETTAQIKGETENYGAAYEQYLEEQAKLSAYEAASKQLLEENTAARVKSDKNKYLQNKVDNILQNSLNDTAENEADNAARLKIKAQERETIDQNAYLQEKTDRILEQLISDTRASEEDRNSEFIISQLNEITDALAGKKEQTEQEKQDILIDLLNKIADELIEDKEASEQVDTSTARTGGSGLGGGPGGHGGLADYYGDLNRTTVYKTGSNAEEVKTADLRDLIEGVKNGTVELSEATRAIEQYAEFNNQKYNLSGQGKGAGSKDPTVNALQQMASASENSANSTDLITDAIPSITSALDNNVAAVQSILPAIPEEPKATDWYSVFDGISVHGDFWGEGNQIVMSDGNGGNIHMNLKDYIAQFNQSLIEMQEIANNNPVNVDINANNAPFISKLQDAINRANRSSATVKVRSEIDGPLNADTKAKGNVALGKGTLMGELGAELYVTGGHYYIAGQNGAEFVDLPDDAIVFNHLQTKRLLGTGSTGRGRAVTNEKKATSYATGNVAMASASDTLAVLKNIKAMWEQLANLSFKDLATKGGGGGGGGKEGLDKGFIADLERWYNLLRQIDKLEKDINYEEKLRSKIQSDRVINGAAIYESQKRSLEMLEQEISAHRELATLQESYYDLRRKEFEQTGYSRIFKFTEQGLMQYNDEDVAKDSNLVGLFSLARLNALDANNQPVYTSKQQYDMLQEMGFGSDLLYTAEGEAIDVSEDDGYAKAVEAFWDKLEGWKDELDGLYDSYREQLDAVLDNETERNKLMQEIVDNQRSVEDKVLEAIENREQATIDKLQEQTDALRDASDQYIDGLNNQLNKERQMYQQQENQEDLRKLRRQLAILERSGGSGSQIANLRAQIAEQEQDQYFDAQQQQIDAIKEASDLQLERLDHQIEIMTETLAYQKENGLLWGEVYEVMARNPQEIVSFITEHSPEWSSQSTLAQSEELKELSNIVSQWSAYYKDKQEGKDVVDTGTSDFDWNSFAPKAAELYKQIWDENKEIARKLFDATYKETGDPNVAWRSVTNYLNPLMSAYKTAHPEEFSSQILPVGTGDSSASSSGSTSKASTDDLYYYVNKNGQIMRATKSWASNNKMSESPVSKDYATVSNWLKNQSGHGWQVNYNGMTYRANTTDRTAAEKLLMNQLLAAGLSSTERDRAMSTLKKYEKGGLADYTGLAMLHGSKQAPESILNAEQTRVLREDILSNKPDSLLSQLQFLHDLWTNTATSSGALNNNNSIIIEKAEVNMNVDSIANDYDAQRAGKQALEQMLAIARKTSVQNLRR